MAMDEGLFEKSVQVEASTLTLAEPAPAEQWLSFTKEAIESEDKEALRRLHGKVHAADLADLVEYLSHDERQGLFELRPQLLDSRLLIELDEDLRADIIADMPPQRVARALIELETDDQIELIENLDEVKKEQILATIPLAERRRLRQTLTFPEYSAGRLMASKMVALPQHWNVGQAIDYLRAAQDLPDAFHDIYILSEGFRPVGKLPLARFMRSRRDTPLVHIAQTQIHSVLPTLDQEELAYDFRKYSLMTAPVVDEETGRLLGIVTVDDVMDVIGEEAEDDMFKLGGLSGETDVFANTWKTARARFVWLLINLATAVTASMVIKVFEGTIEQLVALAVLMPIVASMGGNAGIQTLTIAVRALAMKDITNATQWRFVGKELLVGQINGVAFAVLIGFVAWLLYGSVALAVVIAAAMVINLIIAAFSGALIPLALEHYKIDPANASGVFLTTITDVVGFFVFLGLAALILV